MKYRICLPFANGWVFLGFIKQVVSDSEGVKCREIENAVLQKDPELKAQYDIFLKHIPEGPSGVEVEPVSTDPLVTSYAEYCQRDQEEREKEEDELVRLLNKQKSHFDLLTWNRRVTETVSKREARRKANY